MKARTTGCSRPANRAVTTASPTVATQNTPTSDHANRARTRRRVATGTGTPACEPASAIHFSSSSTSCIDWRRSSGSLARQVRTRRSSPGGDSGWTEAIGGGSRSRIEAIRLACVLPSNALRPVAIS